jgi:acetyl-CoA C-acetyltransferase
MKGFNERVAVIGAGMTRFVRRAEESPGEMTALAVKMALDDAGMTLDEIDAVCLGTAPDAFDGVHMKGEHLLAGAGGTNKPYMRDYVGGGTGVFTPIHGWMHVASGKFDTCLVVCEEKMSPCAPHPAGAFLTIFDHTTEQPLKLTLIHIFALEMARFMSQYGYTEEEIARVSVMCKKNAKDHPSAQLGMDITVEDVMKSTLLSWPVKRYDISPTSDAAVALVFAKERVARARKNAVAFVDGVGFRLETSYWCTRDLAYPNYVAMAARDAYQMAGITDPYKEIDIFEPYDPFDYKALHHLNALMQDKTGKRVRDLLLSGNLERDGSHPMCPSGGLLGVGNPIAAAGTMKVAELYLQLTGQAGARQVKKEVHRGVAQAWGDLMQVGTVMVMSSDGALPTHHTAWADRKAEDMPVKGLKDLSGVPVIEDRPDFSYAWDNGVALTTYLDGLKRGKIIGSRARASGRVVVPCRAFDEIAGLRPVDEYVELADTGTVQTYTLSHVDWDSSQLPDGKVNIFAVIALDGATDPQGLVHLLGQVDPKDVKIGMRVKAVWKAADQREGSVTDIQYFRPIADGEVVPAPELKVIKPVELNVVTAKAFPGKIPLFFRYTAGIGGRKFYEGLAQGKVIGTWSEGHDAPMVPPAIFDDLDMEMLDVEKVVEIDPESGTIDSFTAVYEDRLGHVLDEPVFVVAVTFDEAIGTVFGRLKVDGGQSFGIGSCVKLATNGPVNGPDDVVFELL